MFKPIVLAAALAFAAAAPALAQTAPADATAPAPDAASVVVAEQVITNLGMFDIMVYGYDQGVRESEDFNDLTADQKERYIAIFNLRVDAERPALVHKLALNAASRVTRDEMTDMLALSKIGYLKAIIKASAEGTPDPDPDMMSADEKKLFDQFSNADFVSRFLDGVDVNLIGDDVIRIGADAYTAFLAETNAKTPS